MTTREPLFVRLSLFDRKDDLIALGCLAPPDLNDRSWKVGDKVTLTVVGVQKSGWEGITVR